MADFKILMHAGISKWEDGNIFLYDFKKTVEHKTAQMGLPMEVDFVTYGFTPKERSKITYHNIYDDMKADLLIDRIATMYPFGAHILRTAALEGIQVMNYPVAFDECKSLDYQLAREIDIFKSTGIKVPKTIMPLTSDVAKVMMVGEGGQDYRHEINFPEIVDYLGGYPVYLKAAHGGGKQDVYKCRDFDELMNNYLSVKRTMVIQQNIDFDHYVRCFAIGDKITIIKYDPDAPECNRYKPDVNHLTPEEGTMIYNAIVKLNKNLGYIMNTLEFARDRHTGQWYAIDFTNGCNFDMRPCELTDQYYSLIMHHIVDTAIDYVLNPRPIKIMSPNFFMANERLIKRMKGKPGVSFDRFYEELDEYKNQIFELEKSME